MADRSWDTTKMYAGAISTGRRKTSLKDRNYPERTSQGCNKNLDSKRTRWNWFPFAEQWVLDSARLRMSVDVIRGAGAWLIEEGTVAVDVT